MVKVVEVVEVVEKVPLRGEMILVIPDAMRSWDMGNYRDLEAWQVSRALANATYRLTDAFPATERYGLAAQMRRAGVSIMSNIAEGAGRGSDSQFAQFVRIARGSLRELESQRLLAEDLGLVKQPALAEVDDLLTQQGRLLHALLRWLTQPRKP